MTTPVVPACPAWPVWSGRSDPDLASDELPSILVIESDPGIGGPIADQLTADGYRAGLAQTPRHARALAGMSPPVLAVLGCLESPRGALDLLGEIRRGAPWREDLPVIVIGSSAERLDLLRAFEAGADDFLARPLSYLELRARLRALLRRATGWRQSERRLQIGPLHLDLPAHAVSLHGRPVLLRRLEYELLVHLAREPTRVFPKPELLRAIWEYQALGSTRTLDSHASRLRRKLAGYDPNRRQRWVINVRGVGYRLV